MKIGLLFLMVTSVCFVSCVSTAHIKTDNLVDLYNPTNPENIEIYSVKDIGRKYTIIGIVVASADAGVDASISVNYLKMEAAKLGADAIVNMRLEFDTGYWLLAIKATGIAVKYID